MTAEKKKNKKNEVLKTWNEVDFRLHVPTVINKNNKIEVHFTYINPDDGSKKQIKRSTGIDRNADVKTYTEQANKLVNALILLLEQNFNFITNSLPEHQKLYKGSKISDCIAVWLKERDAHYEDGKMLTSELTATKSIFFMFSNYLKKNHLLGNNPDVLTKNDIDKFMRAVEKDRSELNEDKSKSAKKKLSPRSYNLYLSRLSYFFEFLIEERISFFNPTKGAFRYNTTSMKSRNEIFEDDELQKVRTIIQNDEKYKPMLIASNLLYGFRIRFKEQYRIKVSFINFETGLIQFPEKVEEFGEIVNATKNGKSATFQVSQNIINLMKDYLGDDIEQPDYFLFGAKNRPGLTQRSPSHFSIKWNAFREKHGFGEHLKFYALKHTANYNALKNNMSMQELSQLNRHADMKVTNDYVKHKLSKDVIKIDASGEF